jgi:hypothetical protein
VSEHGGLLGSNLIFSDGPAGVMMTHEQFNAHIKASHAAGLEAGKKAVTQLITAWEALPGGRNYSSREIEEWLQWDMKPAIDKAREFINKNAS